MLTREQNFEVAVTWSGNLGTGTSGHRQYSRNHDIDTAQLPTIQGSADKTFHGDEKRWNPELLFLASISECHMMTYLYLATKAGVRVLAYQDNASGTLLIDANGVGGEFSQITLKPEVTIAASNTQDQSQQLAQKLHDDVGQYCFIARSVKASIRHEATILLS